ncbi:ABC transporter permease [Kribbella sp. NPDC056951]|uniref:ABC transporter permease n=1 Tax=Kribbella sp. NPDC056951 TaxID=3345978 RepID=UPI003629E114
MRLALHGEWTKLRTVAGPLWLLVGTVAVTVALSAVATSVVSCTAAGCGGDTTRLTVSGIYLGQALVAVLAVLVISGEYGSGMVRTSLTAIPRRTTLFVAKAVILSGVVALAATVAVIGSYVAGRLVLPPPGNQALSLATLRAIGGAVVYLVLIGLLSLGVATAARDSAASIGGVLGLLYIVPIISQTISDPDWQRRLEKLAPMTGGLGVTAVWAGLALVVGGLLLRLRDS